MRERHPTWEASSTVPSIAVVAGPAGSSWTSRSFISRGDVLVPDIAGWRRERMPTLPDVSAFELASDWVCEVLSPSTAPLDRTRKMPIYAREKVGYVWLVDPALRMLEAFRFDGSGYHVVGAWHGDTTVQCEPFDIHPIDLADLWSA